MKSNTVQYLLLIIADIVVIGVTLWFGLQGVPVWNIVLLSFSQIVVGFFTMQNLGHLLKITENQKNELCYIITDIMLIIAWPVIFLLLLFDKKK